MTRLYTFPTMQRLDEAAKSTPDFMRPNRIPFAAVGEGLLTNEECNSIIGKSMKEEPYRFNNCNASTRELPMPLNDAFKPIEEFVKACNRVFWQYDLDDEPAAWLQTYSPRDYYQTHVDSAPGQMRKLTAVAMLSPESTYSGGMLEIFFPPVPFMVPKARGTVVVFQPWLHHQVHPVNFGTRQTINMGFYGPPFK